MSDQRRNPDRANGRRILDRMSIPVLLVTADASRGSSNLATLPRAGNISSDTRAGALG